MEADILLAADGVKSITRTPMLAQLGTAHRRRRIRAEACPDHAARERRWRATRRCLRSWTATHVVRWIGERRHARVPGIEPPQIYNLSSAQPDTNFASATNATYEATKGSRRPCSKCARTSARSYTAC